MDEKQMLSEKPDSSQPINPEYHKMRLSQLGLTLDAIRSLSMSPTYDASLARLVTQMRDRFGFYHISVFLLDKNRKALLLEAGSGDTGNRMKLSSYRHDLEDHSIVTQAFTSNKHILVSDTKTDPLFRADSLLPDTQAELALPVEFNGNLIGVLDFHSKDMSLFSVEDITYFELICSELGAAISTSKEIKNTQERLRKNELFNKISASVTASTELGRALQITSDGLFNAIPQSQIAIFLPDDEGNLTIHNSTGYENIDTSSIKVKTGEGIVGLVAKNSEAIRINETQGDPRFIPIDPKIRSEIAVPINFQDSLMGVINVESRVPNSFDDADLEILTTLGRSLGAILSGVKLIEETRRKAFLEQRLNRLMAQFSQVTSVEDVLKTVTREIGQLPEVSAVSVHLNAGTSS